MWKTFLVDLEAITIMGEKIYAVAALCLDTILDDLFPAAFCCQVQVPSADPMTLLFRMSDPDNSFQRRLSRFKFVNEEVFDRFC